MQGSLESDEFLEAEALSKVFGHSVSHAQVTRALECSSEEGHVEPDLTVAVRDASFSVARGEIFVLMGLSGSGKSTLLRMINRLVEPSRGTVRIAGRDVTRMSAGELVDVRRSLMAMVFQSFALLPGRSVVENAAFGLEVAGVPRRERRERARVALENVGLADYADRWPHELSGGMKQRVGLARALCVEPELLLMDEPFSALDPLIRRDMQEQLLALQADSQRTIVFVSHDLDEAVRIGNRIAIMRAGSILQVGTPEEITGAPADDFVRRFVQSAGGRAS